MGTLPPIFRSEPIYVNGKVSYTGHCTAVYSVEQAIDVLDRIGAGTGSEDCLPFAVTLVENGELISIAEDQGEFGSGDLLADALNGLDGFNALVCVSRKVYGCYVSDMIQSQKLRVIREAAVKALAILYDHLRPAGPLSYDEKSSSVCRHDRSFPVKKVSLEPPKLTFDQEMAMQLSNRRPRRRQQGPH